MGTTAVIGTGLLGSGFVEALRRRGVDVTVWNRTAAKARALESLGAKVAASPAEAVRGADRVHLILSDDAAVDAVLAEARPECPIFDHTTTSAAGAAGRSREWPRYLHAPVFMGPGNARDASGLMLASGPADRFEAGRPVLETMTGKLWYVGERPDLAAAYKLFGNAMLITLTAGVADVFAMATALDIPQADALAVFANFQLSGFVTTRGAKMAKAQYEPASFELTMARKDIRLMIEAAAGQKLAVLHGIAAVMDEHIAAGQGSFDFSIIAKQ